MKHHASHSAVSGSLDGFAALMAAATEHRRQAARAILAGRPLPPEIPAALGRARDELDDALDRDGVAELTREDDQPLRLDLSEETAQLDNDVVYLEEGREALLRHLAKRHHGFRDAVRRGLRDIAKHGVHLLLCDADALFRAPGQRFLTAVQPVWNAVALGRFAAARSARPVLWTDAPLAGPGLAELVTMPPRAFTWAASLGRQIVDEAGHESAWPLSPQKAALLESINARLAMLLADPSWSAFAYVGSGLQFRRGETVVARQDSRESVDEEASLALLEHVHDVVDAVDPEREHFRVEDDGRDVVVTPTASQRDQGQEFTPAEGLTAVERALSLDFGQGPHLVCCGGASGLRLLAGLMEKTQDLACLFVTDREDLGRQARELCPNTAVIGHPDVAAAVFSAAAP